MRHERKADRRAQQRLRPRRERLVERAERGRDERGGLIEHGPDGSVRHARHPGRALGGARITASLVRGRSTASAWAQIATASAAE